MEQDYLFAGKACASGKRCCCMQACAIAKGVMQQLQLALQRKQPPNVQANKELQPQALSPAAPYGPAPPGPARKGGLPPAMISCTAARAPSTAGGCPATVTFIGSVCWSIWMLAPKFFCSALMVSPPLPMTRPTMDLGQSTVRVMPAPYCKHWRLGELKTHSRNETRVKGNGGGSAQKAAVEPASRVGQRQLPASQKACRSLGRE